MKLKNLLIIGIVLLIVIVCGIVWFNFREKKTSILAGTEEKKGYVGEPDSKITLLVKNNTGETMSHFYISRSDDSKKWYEYLKGKTINNGGSIAIDLVNYEDGKKWNIQIGTAEGGIYKLSELESEYVYDGAELSLSLNDGALALNALNVFEKGWDISLSFSNNTGKEISGIYMKKIGDNDWENLLYNSTLKDKETAYIIYSNYNRTKAWNIKVTTTDGEEYIYKDTVDSLYIDDNVFLQFEIDSKNNLTILRYMK